MFNFGRKRARTIANRLGKTMVIMRHACHDADLQSLASILQSYKYTRLEIPPREFGPIAGWTEGPPEDADMVYLIQSYFEPKDTVFQVLAEGRGNLAGLILTGGRDGINVEVSDVRRTLRKLGRDSLAVQQELLRLPGFGSNQDSLTELGIR